MRRRGPLRRRRAPLAPHLHVFASADAPPPRLYQLRSLAPRFALTGVAAMFSEAVTFPIDITKTRMQLAGEGGAGAARRGAFATFAAMLRAEGVAGLYAGVGPAMLRHVPYSGTRIVAYEAFRSRVGGSAHDASVATKMALGAAAGALGQLVAVPADVLKVRLQAAGAAAPGVAVPRPGMAAAAASIWRAEGMAGFWRGGLPAVQRAGLVNLGELATYDAAKRWAAAHAPSGLAAACGCTHAADAPPVHVFSALASGFVACAASTPADVVKTRLMAQRRSSGPPRYAGALDCLRQSVAQEGLRVLYRGFLPTWARLGPWQLTFWLTYERLRQIGGFESF